MATTRYEKPAPISEALYVCPNRHVTTLNFHAQVKDFPKTWECSTCHQNAKYAGSAGILTSETVPDPKKLSNEMLGNTVDDTETYADQESPEELHDTHLAALYERRTIAELEAILESRLVAYRNNDQFRLAKASDVVL